MARDWERIRQEYVTDRSATHASLASKFGVPARTIRWHCTREGWAVDRGQHCQRVADQLARNTAKLSARSLAEINEEHLRRNAHLRTMVMNKLLVRDEAGRPALRTDITLVDIHRAVQCFASLFEMDRTVLGADAEGMQSRPRDRLDELTDEEVLEELKRLRAKTTIVQ